MSELKNKVEAILFSVGRYIGLEEISRLCNKDPQKVKDVLIELQVEYEDRNSAMLILNEGDVWKLATREEYGNVVRKVVSETELTKSQLETLAVIAFKYPIKQADLIRIRTNKAYDHLTELEKTGFITRKKYGRSKLIKLTDKFFEYFDLPRDKLKDRFKGFNELAQTIENKEDEIEKIKEVQKKEAEEDKKTEDNEKKVMDGDIEIDLVDDQGEKHKVEVFEEKEEPAEIEKVEEKVGELEVVDTEKKEETKEENNEVNLEYSEGQDNELEEETNEEDQRSNEEKMKDILAEVADEDGSSEKEGREDEEVEQSDEEELRKGIDEGVDLLDANVQEQEEDKKKGDENVSP